MDCSLSDAFDVCDGGIAEVRVVPQIEEIRRKAQDCRSVILKFLSSEKSQFCCPGPR